MKKHVFKKVTIVGLGLLGGSIGRDLKKKRLAEWVFGVSRHPKTIQEAFTKNAIDIGTLQLKDGVQDADLVILCAPVSVIKRQIQEMSQWLHPKTIVIDVGSSKEQIEAVARKYLRPGQFIGCHPMAGSEKTGIQSSHLGLFKNAICFMSQKNKTVENFWKELEAKPVILAPKMHDAFVARASHIPHILAFSLFAQPMSAYSDVANPSLREWARLARSDAGLWLEILFSNQAFVSGGLKQMEKNLASWRKAIDSGNKKAIQKWIQNANRQSKHFRISA